MRDSIKYPDSIFYARWTEVTEYSELDKAVIKILYSDEIEPNMTQSEAREVLESPSPRNRCCTQVQSDLGSGADDKLRELWYNGNKALLPMESRWEKTTRRQGLWTSSQKALRGLETPRVYRYSP